MRSIHNVRYTLEHKVIPGWLYNEKETLVYALLSRDDLLYAVISDMLSEQGLLNPYSPGQFKAVPLEPEDDVCGIKIMFPEPEDEPLCYYAILFFDWNFTRLSYFTVERGNDFGRQRPFICGWDKNGTHLNYGSLEFDDDSILELCRSIHNGYNRGVKVGA